MSAGDPVREYAAATRSRGAPRCTGRGRDPPLARGRAGARAGGKLAKDAVKHVDPGDAPGKHGDDCRHFIAPANALTATCRIVDGPINPQRHCIAFTPKATSAT